jgi:FkbM family methyltransferase
MGTHLQRCRTLAGAILKPRFAEHAWLLESVIRPGTDVIDIGANVGHFSRQFCNRVRGGRVYACEPGGFARWVLEMRARITGLRNLHVMPFAASDTCGVAILYSGTKPSGKFNHTGSSLRPRGRWRTRFEEIVTTLTIDRLVEVCGITELSLIKIDAEGAERLILDGAKGTIAKYKPVIIAEVRDGLLAEFGSSADRVWSAMRRAGYRAFDIEHGELVALQRPQDGPHITFIHAESHLLSENGPLAQTLSIAA